MRLTATTIASLDCPAGRDEKTFFDERLPGFGLRVRASGAKTWVVHYGPSRRKRRVTLGPPAAIDPGKAFAEAKTLLAAIKLGGDPAGEKAARRARAAETFAALLPRYLERQRARLRPRSMVEIERHLGEHSKPLHSSPVGLIDRRAGARLLMALAETNGPGAANRTRSSLSGYFTWLLRAGFIDINPIAFTDKAIETGARSRVLADHELKAIWAALLDDDYGAIAKLLMLTGARRDEIGGLRWSEIDRAAATATLPASRTKNRREHVIPLSAPALAVLEPRARLKESAGPGRDLVFGRGLGDRGFQEWSGSVRDLRARLALAGEPIAGWVLHDFRRTLSTRLHENFNVQPHVVETILGHVSGHKAGVAGTYNKALYLDERRRALARWGEHIAGLVAGEPIVARIVNLR